MKQSNLSGVALAALCLSMGCDRDEPTSERTVVVDPAEPARSRTSEPVHVEAEPRPSPEQGGRDVAATPHAPAGADAPAQPAPPGQDLSDEAEATRAEYVAAAHRRLDEMDRELQRLEQRSRERGKELRSDMRERKQRLDADLQRLDRESDEAWTKTRSGFADALQRLETEIRTVRKDIDPDA